MQVEIIIIIIGLILDRVTKLWASGPLSSGNEIVIIKDIFSFRYLENQGAAFGIFQNMQLPLAIVTIIVVIGIIFYLIKSRPKQLILRISLSLIISGALGNLYDRIRFRYVVDFIYFHFKDNQFPTFNVSDMLVVVGTFLLAYFILKEDFNEDK
jgi:signal peptidase II